MQFLFVRVVPKCSMLSNYLLPERERERERGGGGGGTRRLEKMA
jgi:hypothetical protein